MPRLGFGPAAVAFVWVLTGTGRAVGRKREWAGPCLLLTRAGRQSFVSSAPGSGALSLPCRGSGRSRRSAAGQGSTRHFPSLPGGSGCFPGSRGSAAPSPTPPPPHPASRACSLPLLTQCPHSCLQTLTKASRGKMALLPTPFYVSAALDTARHPPRISALQMLFNRPLCTQAAPYGKGDGPVW